MLKLILICIGIYICGIPITIVIFDAIEKANNFISIHKTGKPPRKSSDDPDSLSVSFFWPILIIVGIVIGFVKSIVWILARSTGWLSDKIGTKAAELIIKKEAKTVRRAMEKK